MHSSSCGSGTSNGETIAISYAVHVGWLCASMSNVWMFDRPGKQRNNKLRVVGSCFGDCPAMRGVWIVYNLRIDRRGIRNMISEYPIISRMFGFLSTISIGNDDGMVIGNI